MCDAGGALAHRSVPHLDTTSMHMAEAGDCLRSNPGRSSMSNRPPLSPYCPSANPLVNSFSAGFNMFSVDRVQSSPCIMQTDHAEYPESNRPTHEPMQEEEARARLSIGSEEHPAGMCAVLQGGNSTLRASSDPFLATSCDSLSGRPVEDFAVLPANVWDSGTQEGVSAEAECLGLTELSLESSNRGSTAGNPGLQKRADTQSDCQTIDQPDVQEGLCIGQALSVDQHMICCSSNSAVEAASAAASVSGLTASSSPCCTFQLPTALSQGIAASPAPSGDTSSEGSGRRKSFSPLESGPVSILPLVENALIGLPSVSCATLAQLIAGQRDSPSIQVKIVDCRWVSVLALHLV